MDISIYQNNTGSAPAIHWWLSQELNIGPKDLYEFNTGYCRPNGHHIGAIVIENEQSPHHSQHKKSIALLDNTEKGIIDPFVPFDETLKSQFDHFVWSNYTSNLANLDNIIKADKTLLVDNSMEEQLFFYISQYAFAWLESEDDITEQTQQWAEEQNIENWLEVWNEKYSEQFKKAFADGKLKYMWQLNFAHHDLADSLEKGNDNIELIDADDHTRLFKTKRQQLEDSTETLFTYANSETSHMVVGDDWFDQTPEILEYLEVMPSFRLKKFMIDYTKLYKRKKELYINTFGNYL